MAILSGGQSTRIRLERPQLREPREFGDNALEVEVATVLVLGHCVWVFTGAFAERAFDV